MILKAFAFLDTKTGAYSVPFFSSHPGAALRMATDLANDPGTSIGRHPADYVFYQVGTFCDVTAQFMSTLESYGSCSGLVVSAPRLPLE